MPKRPGRPPLDQISGHKTRRINLHLTRELQGRLTKAARLRKKSRSSIIREMLDRELPTAPPLALEEIAAAPPRSPAAPPKPEPFPNPEPYVSEGPEPVFDPVTGIYSFPGEEP